MDIRYLNKLLSDDKLLSEKIDNYFLEKAITKLPVDNEEIKGHLLKSDNNLRFVKDNLELGYLDWCITGCYYAVYHAVLALNIVKGYYSKSHDASLCLLIKGYYKKGVSAEDIELLNKFFLDYNEISFYVQSKQKREEATYSTTIKFDNALVNELRIKAALFVNKAKQILENNK